MEEQHMKQFANPHTGELEWRYQPHPDSDESLKRAYENVPKQARAHFRKTIEQWTDKSEESEPKRQPGEGAATFELRRQQNWKDREKVLKQRTISAYEESLKPTKEQKIMALMEKTAKVENKKREAKEKATAAEEKAKAEVQAKGRRMDMRREYGI